jgi:hypothetical protein
LRYPSIKLIVSVHRGRLGSRLGCLLEESHASFFEVLLFH